MASIQGTIPDQTWATSLPGYFKQNVKPNIADYAFLIPRDNLTFPSIVSESSVGQAYDRGFIDRVPSRSETIRRPIVYPEVYAMRLHPHDLTSGTGGIDNLNNLYRFGHPLPFADGEDFIDFSYWASRELTKEADDPLSAGFGVKAVENAIYGQFGGRMIAEWRDKFKEKYNQYMIQHMRELAQGKTYVEGDEQLIERAARVRAAESAARDLGINRRGGGGGSGGAIGGGGDDDDGGDDGGNGGGGDTNIGGLTGVTAGIVENAKLEPDVKEYISENKPQPSNTSFANTAISSIRAPIKFTYSDILTRGTYGGTNTGLDAGNNNERANDIRLQNYERALKYAPLLSTMGTRNADTSLQTRQTQNLVRNLNSNTIDGNLENPLQASSLGQQVYKVEPDSSAYVFNASSTGQEAMQLSNQNVGVVDGLATHLGGGSTPRPRDYRAVNYERAQAEHRKEYTESAKSQRVQTLNARRSEPRKIEDTQEYKKLYDQFLYGNYSRQRLQKYVKHGANPVTVAAAKAALLNFAKV